MSYEWITDALCNRFLQLSAQASHFDKAVINTVLQIIGNKELSSKQVTALFYTDCPLREVIKNLRNVTSARDALRDYADSLIEYHKTVPVIHNRDCTNAETILSKYLSAICMSAIDKSITSHYSNNSLDSESALKEVMRKHGLHRIKFILVVNIRHYSYDGRISEDNKRWAACAKVEDSEEHKRLLLTGVHPGLLDLFTSTLRRFLLE